jgi:hypothetical protein
MTNEILPTVAQPNLTDIEIQVARIRAASEATQAQQYKAEHDNFNRQIETMLSDTAESQLGAIALTHSEVASSNFNLPTDEN